MSMSPPSGAENQPWSQSPPHAPPPPPPPPPTPTSTSPPAAAAGPPPPPSGPHPGLTPPGYVAYQQAGSLVSTSMESTAGLRKATIALFWVTVGASGLSAVTMFLRRGVWDDFLAGNAGLNDLDEADGLVFSVGLLTAALTIAAGIVLSIWTLRFVRNAERLSGRNLQPGLACGGWYIPIGNMFVPFIRLRAAMRSLQGSQQSTSSWQASWIAMLVCGAISRSVFDFSVSSPADDVGAALSNQATFALVTTAVVAVTAFLGQRALNQLDDALIARREQVMPPA